MNTKVDREKIAEALRGLPFVLSDHDEGGGITATYTGLLVRGLEARGQATELLRKAGLSAFVINWYTLHIASPDVAGQPMLSGGVSQ